MRAKVLFPPNIIEEVRFATDSALEEADLPPMIKRKKAGQ
jgi:hypothetical protein